MDWSIDDVAAVKRGYDIIMRKGNELDDPDSRFHYPPVCPSWQWKKEFASQYNEIVSWICGRYGDKGLWLAGNPGTGKSTLMRAVMNYCAVTYDLRSPNLPRVSRWRHAKDIASGYEQDGAEYLTELCKAETLIIDDLGTEPNSTMRYGNAINVVEDLMSRRYDKRLMTMVTTNLTMAQVREIYRDRIYDRIRETFHVIEFKGASHRKNFNPDI